MSIENIITQIATIQKTITGVKKAYDESPSSLSTFPCFVNFPSSGDIERGASQRSIEHTIKMQFFVAKPDLPSAENKLRPFVARVLDKFDQEMKLNGAATYSTISRYEYGGMSYAGRPYLGISFDLVVLEHEGKTFNE